MPEWLAQISAGAIVPDGLAEWAQAHASFDAAWQACPRPDWLVWLASRNHPTEEQQRHIVRKACYLADRKRSNLPQGVLRPTLTDLQLAHEWVDPGGSSVEYLVGDFFNALIVAAVGVVPIVIAVRLHWPTLGVWRRTLYSDLITIPSAVVLTAIAFFILSWRKKASPM